MNDKKKKLKLKEIKLESVDKDKLFPTRIKGHNKVITGIIDDIEVCYVCMDIFGEVVQPHIYIAKKYRNKEVIETMVKMFSTHVKPWCKKQGCTTMIINCLASDKKTTSLFKTFGFEFETINISVQKI